MEREPMPTPPMATREVEEMADERTGGYTRDLASYARVWAEDAPEPLRSWSREWLAWRAELEAWAKRQPVCIDLEQPAFRLFGGETIALSFGVRGADRFHNLRRLAMRVADAGSEAECREWAARVYEWLSVARRMEAAIVEHAERIVGDDGDGERGAFDEATSEAVDRVTPEVHRDEWLGSWCIWRRGTRGGSPRGLLQSYDEYGDREGKGED